MNNIVCSYGCVATTDSQGVGTIRDLTSDELGKMLRLLQKQSEDKREEISVRNPNNKSHAANDFKRGG